MYSSTYTYTETEDIKESLSYDDITILPSRIKSRIESRSKCNLSTSIFKGVEIGTPIIGSCMETVTGARMAAQLSSLGAIGCIHRMFKTTDENIKEWEDFKNRTRAYISYTVGYNQGSCSAGVKETYGQTIIAIAATKDYYERFLEGVQKRVQNVRYRHSKWALNDSRESDRKD